jgi:ubiquinone/menaquinone biosynthesis C-methylase UbiE
MLNSLFALVSCCAQLAKELAEMVGMKQQQPSTARVCDLCCGVGMSTRALQKAFPEADTILGIDTSKEMVAMANFITKHASRVKRFSDDVFNNNKSRDQQTTRLSNNVTAPHFVCANAERTDLPDESFDLVTVMYAFHEIPHRGRGAILGESRRLLKRGGTLAVVDISPEYRPSERMLGGEPYVQEYQQNIHQQINDCEGFSNEKRYQTIVPNQLGMWVLQRATA